MVKFKHRGKRAKSRAKYTKRVRQKGRPSVTARLKKFNVGERVHINVEPSEHGGMPFKRFSGRTGTVLRMQGRCCVVQIRDVRATKEVLVHPVHLKLQK